MHTTTDITINNTKVKIKQTFSVLHVENSKIKSFKQFNL